MSRIDLSVLEAAIMPWAKEHMPTAYAQTIGRRGAPRAYRKYMQRLVEHRYKKDPDWNPPLRLLEDTTIRARFVHNGHEFEVKGSRCKGLRKMSWNLMASIMEQDVPVDAFKAAVEHLDLFVADDDRPDAWEIPDLPDDPEPFDPGSGPEAAPSLSPVSCPVCRSNPMADGLYTCAQCAENTKSKQGSFL